MTDQEYARIYDRKADYIYWTPPSCGGFYRPPLHKGICPECHEVNGSEDNNNLCSFCASLSPCCGVEFDKDYRICPRCREQL